MATSNIKEAADRAEAIFVVVPPVGRKSINELIAPVLTDSQLVALFPGTFGTITFLEERCSTSGGHENQTFSTTRPIHEIDKGE